MSPHDDLPPPSDPQPSPPDPAGNPSPDGAPASHRGQLGASGTRRRRVVIAVLAAALLLLGVGAISAAGGRGAPFGQWHPGADPATLEPTRQPTPTPEPTPEPTLIRLSATGDIILGDAGSLPPEDGAGFFDEVADALVADLTMGNLEQPLTDDTGHEKCDEDSDACHAFRAPPHYAAHLRDAGFDLMNLANNHGNDFGPAGRENTRAALEQHDIAHTGERDQITVVEVAEASIAVVGFSPYAWTNALNDHEQARAVVTQAADAADLVVVQVHMGAEGADATEVKPGSEIFYEEDRGDPMAFSRAVIDAGADLVIGHGPHVLRGLEFYRDRLIAYSLGNFAGGGGTLNAEGILGVGAVLRVDLHPDGSFAGGELISTHMREAGIPKLDPQQQALELARDLTEQDFPDTGAQLGPDGEITAP